jgi:hypothetical protein
MLSPHLVRRATPLGRSCVPAVGWVLLVAAAVVLSSCGLSTWIEFEARDEARAAVFGGDQEALAQLVSDHPALRKRDAQELLLGSTACQPEMARFMLDDLGFRADTDFEGWGVLNEILAPVTGEEDLPNTEAECSTGDLVRTLRILLAAGASPCLSPDEDDASRPLLAAEAWGYSEAVQKELASHGFRC